MHRKETTKRPDVGLRRATGQGRDDWYATLDAWGAKERPYRDIARWLRDTHRVSAWWAQKLVVEYQQSRGVRAPGVRPDGTFSATVSRTLAFPAERIFGAFVEATLRERWLPGASMKLRTSRPAQSARFDWDNGASRVNLTLLADEGKCQVAVTHERLHDTKSAEHMKAFWRERLTALGKVLGR